MARQREQDPDLDVVERIYDALDREDFDEALQTVREALAEDAVDDPVVHFFGGHCLLELDRPAEAASMLDKAVKLDPDDPDMRAALAHARYRCCRFDEAAADAARALEIDDGSPEGHHVTALLLERSGRFDDADRYFERAAELDPEGYAKPLRIGRGEFEREIDKAREILDETFRKILDEVVVTVEHLPSDDILLDENPPLDPELLGLFVGVPRSEPRSFSPGGELPPRILLFQRTLERSFTDREELAAEIARTLHHELAHYIGKDEEDMEELRLL
jgi:predicted Zn-dependent protease with MMP-like domain